MDFAEFYRATSPRLLRYAYGLTGDLPLAQDVTQEAYARAWQRWRSVSRHHDVEAWLRVVVTRLVYDWWRRLAVRRERVEQPQTVPAPSEETVVLSIALQQLPRAQAQALALHYLLDLPISQIAAETGVAEGTVKSWLSRGRASLADLLREEAQTANLATASEVQDRGVRRRRTRVIVTVVISVALIAGIAVWGRLHDRHPQPVAPSPSPAALQRITGLDAGAPDGGDPSVAIVGDRGYAAWRTAGKDTATVIAVDLASGRKLWSTTDVWSSVRRYYAGSDVVVVQGSANVSGLNEMTALGPDGQTLWRQRTDNQVRLIPFHGVLVKAEGDDGLSGLDWRTGKVLWRNPQPVQDVVVMHRAADEESEAVQEPVTESGNLFAIVGDRATQVDVATGRSVRLWTGTLTGAFRSYAAYEGKLYVAGDNRLTTIDLGGSGPVVDYEDPENRILETPMPCFHTAVCVTAVGKVRSVLVIRGHDVVYSHDGGVRTHPPMAAGNSMMIPLPTEVIGPVVAVGADPAGAWHTSETVGAPLWIDDTRLLLRDREFAIVNVDPKSGVRRTLGRLDGDTYAIASDGRFLIAAYVPGKFGIYRLAP